MLRSSQTQSRRLKLVFCEVMGDRETWQVRDRDVIDCAVCGWIKGM